MSNNPITFRPTDDDLKTINRIIATNDRPGLNLRPVNAIRIALAVWATNHPEENMNTTSRYDQARARMDEFGFTDAQIEFALADLPEGDDHLDWLITATREEIVSWGEAANWGQADDAVELSDSAICFLENPWSGAVEMMRWGEIVKWAEEHVHDSDRDEWLREARRAAAADDSETLGAMIVGS